MTRLLRRAICTAYFLCFSNTSMAGPQETLDLWLYVQDPDSGANFSDISDFLDRHPTWPDRKKIQVRAERTMRASGISDTEIMAWFVAHPPVSGVGKWTYAEALNRQRVDTANMKTQAREAWREADLTADEESAFLGMFGQYLATDDHIARVDRLLWEGKTTQALRSIPRLPSERQAVEQARISLMSDDKKAPSMVGHVSGKLQNDPGLLFERMNYRLRKNDKDGVREILLATPKNIPYAERWWKVREREIRRAIDEGHYQMASRLLSNHGQSEGMGFADALWLDGWLKLEFLNNAKEAYTAFYHMHDAVKSPVSKARAAYWAGRAAKKSTDESTARNWFESASKHPTTFYGQLATAELSNTPSLSLPAEPGFGGFFASDPILSDDIEEAIRISIQNNEGKIATRLINHVIARAELERSMLAVAEMGHALAVPHISVKAAKKAQMQGVVLKNVGYPRPDTEGDLPIERPLILSIIRQESEFDPQAESPAGALGMMQLLPGTAKETAKKIEVPYEREGLDTPNYNIRLGSHYLSRMINAFDGSYIMAIAAYNGGPGNVRKWTNQFGTPGSDLYEAINWIEKIPFAETRNYVQRVVENLQVYRALEGNHTLAIREDLVR